MAEELHDGLSSTNDKKHYGERSARRRAHLEAQTNGRGVTRRTELYERVSLVKKHYGERSARRRACTWKLKHMAEELHDGLSYTNEYNINIFRDSNKIAVDTDEIDPTLPRITLAEMLDDLNIEDVEMSDV
ncbi:60S ribosomal export protein NMD3 [Operophtera brumata]|uniref:60S ribosomal export protein NMD3 n=1 Tax=Operophtera brumata TaxID=104452 RepID=A0A0L7KXI7_OPEBR|nr:60S ribosomal export protein NMD3 [Operophtera brumata]